MRGPASFQYRGHLFQAAKTVTLTADALRVRTGSGKDISIPFSQIAKIDLLQRSSPAYGTAFVCRLWRARTLFPILTLGSKSFRGFNDFETKDSSYLAFITQLHGAMLKGNPQCRFEVTVPESALLLSLLSDLHLALPVMFVVFIAALVIGGDIPAAVVATFIAGLGCAAYALRGLTKLGPWRYDPSAIPDAMLPRQGGEVFTER